MKYFIILFLFISLDLNSVGKKNNTLLNLEFVQMIINFENPFRKGFNNNKWKPIRSVEGGTPTIAYGHKLTHEEYRTGKLKIGYNWRKGISETEARELLYSDLQVNIEKANKHFKDFQNFPTYLQQALVNACFRGEVRPERDWVKSINEQNWSNVIHQYLENKEYKKAKKKYDGPGGLANRMEWNAEQFAFYAFNYE